jgi:hypothetical protein
MARCGVLYRTAELVVIDTPAGQKSVISRMAQTPGKGNQAGHNPVGKMDPNPRRALEGRQVDSPSLCESELPGGLRVELD